ncbi:hypothetical protein [uncultured Roseibium sp.]|uniref:hypothetical protein n=1 Tax=uncultured Roseibium sp. TaxID=1936171 RepID=UPI00260B15C9|nr:hypothetical protein [uncultured Roseibium sp.]
MAFSQVQEDHSEDAVQQIKPTARLENKKSKPENPKETQRNPESLLSADVLSLNPQFSGTKNPRT